MTEKQRIEALAGAVYPAVAGLRHVFHREPELGGQEEKTAQRILAALRGWGIEAERLGSSTAVIGHIQGQPGCRTIALRAEMDALPLEETSGVPFASMIPGRMHACGHDFNLANLLGTSYVLQQLRPTFAGNITLIFQPAEEVFGGAAEILAAGVLREPPVAAMLAAHVSARYPLGTIAVKKGLTNMGASSFVVTLEGPGGHAASPHRSADLILAAAQLIVELQMIAGRKINHIEPALVTVSQIEGGQKGNVLPRRVCFSGTVRAQKRSVHEIVAMEMKKLLAARESLSGLKARLEFSFQGDAVCNDPLLTEQLMQSAGQMLGPEHVLCLTAPANGSENFALFSAEVPSVYFHIGGWAEADKVPAAAHQPDFRVADEALLPGIKVLAATALALL